MFFVCLCGTTGTKKGRLIHPSFLFVHLSVKPLIPTSDPRPLWRQNVTIAALVETLVLQLVGMFTVNSSKAPPNRFCNRFLWCTYPHCADSLNSSRRFALCAMPTYLIRGENPRDWLVPSAFCRGSSESLSLSLYGTKTTATHD